jgi:N4-gp56 family major capsid protein
MRENLYGNLYWRQLGTLVTIPRGHGTKAKISRWDTPVTITNGALGIDGGVSAVSKHAEGTAITLKGLCAEDITGEVTGWAGGRGYTDKMIIVSMANFMEGALESLSRELAFRLDTYVRTKVSANAFTQYASDAAGSAPTDDKVPTANVLYGKNMARIRPLMGANGVPTWDDGTYVGMAHELAAHDMLTDISASGFLSVARYNHARMIYRGEMGEFYGVRWLFSNGSVSRIYGAAGTTATYGISAGASGSNAYVVGPDAFYNLELETGGVEVIHQPLGSGGAPSDPAAQLGSISVKIYYGTLPAPSGDKRIMRFVHGTSLHY